MVNLGNEILKLHIYTFKLHIIYYTLIFLQFYPRLNNFGNVLAH